MGKAFCGTTGVYAGGHLAVVPDIDCYPCVRPADCPNNTCTYHITPEIVYRALVQLIDPSADPCAVSSMPETESCRLMVSEFEDDHYLVYRPLKRHRIEYRSFCLLLTRQAIRIILSDNPFKIPEAEIGTSAENVLRQISRHYICSKGDGFESAWHRDREILKQVVLCAESGIALTDKIITQFDTKTVCLKNLKKVTDQIDLIDKKIISACNTLPLLTQFVQLFCFEKEQMHGNDLKCLTEQTRLIYRRLADGCNALEKLGDEIIERLDDNLFLQAAS